MFCPSRLSPTCHFQSLPLGRGLAASGTAAGRRGTAGPALPCAALAGAACAVARRGRAQRRAEVNDEEQRLLELMRVPDTGFEVEKMGECWEDYFAYRNFAPKNRAACTSALSVPLTILDAWRRFELPLLQEVIRIDLLGSRRLELSDIQLLYQELSRAFEMQQVDLRLVGPELPPELPNGEAGAFCLDNLRISFHRMLYQDLLSSQPPPDLAVAFHAGIHEYESWPPALQCLMLKRVPTVVTGYSLADISQGLQVMHSRGMYPSMLHQGVNPFASAERLRVDEALCQLSLVEGYLDTPKLLDYQAQVDAAGGLLELMAAFQAAGKVPEAQTVSINSWLYLFRGE